MENQHRKIVGYRELTQDDIDLMNRIKAAGRVLLDLRAEVMEKLRAQHEALINDLATRHESDPEQWAASAAIDRFNLAEPTRWAGIAKTDLQTGVMALVRAVAQPTDC